jgi:PHD/YefM family antitoxin component YafN of YafNO toxin-antitoxin module
MTRHMGLVFDLAIRLAIQRFAAGRATIALIAALAIRAARFMQIATVVGRMQAARCRGITFARRVGLRSRSSRLNGLRSPSRGSKRRGSPSRRVGLALAVVAVERFAFAITRLEAARLAIARRVGLALAVVTVERFAFAITRLEAARLAITRRVRLALAVVTVERLAFAITRLEAARLAVTRRIRLALAVVTVERFAFAITRFETARLAITRRVGLALAVVTVERFAFAITRLEAALLSRRGGWPRPDDARSKDRAGRRPTVLSSG